VCSQVVTKRQLEKLDAQLTSYLGELFKGMGRRERVEAMGLYAQGLLLEGERKSCEPMARRLVQDEQRTEAMRQRLQQCITYSDWDESVVRGRLARVLEKKLPGVEALLVDDTGFKKKGELSVGVAHQYSGTFSKVENCQVAVSLHLAGERHSACLGMRLYLPEQWAQDEERREQAGVPDEVKFAEKWRLGLGLVDEALEAGVQTRLVVGDAGYGDIIEFRRGLVERGLRYVLGIKHTHVFWTPRLKLTKDGPLNAKKIALKLGPEAFSKVTWREGSKGHQSSYFARVRVRTAADHHHGVRPGEEQWLLIEWPKDHEEPWRYWLSNLPEGISLKQLVRLAKLRWHIERDYQDMKGEVGLDHFEGRTWRGFHHHATLCAVAHGFLALQRALFPPERQRPVPASGTTHDAAGTHPSAGRLPYVPPPHLSC
jgi:SRSO17 transposase